MELTCKEDIPPHREASVLAQTAAESSFTAQGQEQAHGVLGRGCKLCKLLSEPLEDPSCPHVSLVDYSSFYFLP